MSRRIFDAHLHIIDPAFPLQANQGYLPDPFTVDDYLERTRGLGIGGGAVVSGSFQGFDQGYLLDALDRLGPGFCGVTQLPARASDMEILRLSARGVKAVRFNLRRGGSEAVWQLQTFACRVHELAGWHCELYVDSRDLAELESMLLRLPALSIDHLGLSRAGLPTLLRLVERGVRVKATGFGRVDFRVGDILRDLYAANPRALMFGTDLPSTRVPRAFSVDDLTLLCESLGEVGASQVLWDNAIEFYRFSHMADPGVDGLS